jgi:DNA-binding NtrC family response regulator
MTASPPLAFLGHSPAIQQVREKLQLAGQLDLPVLLLGETGTGKGLAAHLIHQSGRRCNRPLIHLDRSSLPAFLLDVERVVQEQEAGATTNPPRPGLVEQVQGSTLLLDEVGELTPEEQTQLLYLLNCRPAEAISLAQDLILDVQVIATSHHHLVQAMEKGTFRADLYYRLHGFPLTLPSLRQRREDIPLLARHFLAQSAAQLHQPPCRLSPVALELLLSHHWPGNVRELRHCLEQAAPLATGGQIGPQHLWHHENRKEIP